MPPRRSPHDLSPHELTRLAETFRLLGDASRLKILLCCLDAPCCVGDIAERLQLSQSLVSHHLRLLRGERLAKQVFYAIDDPHVSRVLLDMASHIVEARDEDQTSEELRPCGQSFSATS